MLDHSQTKHRGMGVPALALCSMYTIGALPSLPIAGLGQQASDAKLYIVLASLALLVIGLLIRLRRMCNRLEQESRAREMSEERLRIMGDSLPDTAFFQIIHNDADSVQFTYISKGVELALGLDRNQILSDAKIAFDHVCKEYIPVLKDAIDRGEKDLAPASVEIQMLDAAGRFKWLHISASPRREMDGVTWDGFMQDITEMKEAEHSVMEENRNLQEQLETIEEFLLVCDLDGRLIHTNPSVENRLGYSERKLASMSIDELYPEDARKEVRQVVRRLQSELSTTCNLPLQMNSGAIIPVEMNLFQGLWQNKKAIFGVARDMLRRQQADTILRESKRMLQMIIDTIPMSVFWKDKDSVYLGCNKSFIRERGLNSIDQVVGRTAFDLFEPSIAKEMHERDQEIISTNHAIDYQKESYTRIDGTTGWREISKVPLRNTVGQAVGVLGIWRDVTEQHIADERLKQTLADMERFNQLMRGRERRTLELKAEINYLLNELGQSSKYQTTSDDLT